MKIIIVFVIGLSLFITLRFLYFVLHRKGWANIGGQHIQKFLPGLEFVAWLIFIFWGLDYLLKAKSYYPFLIISLVIILTGLIAWFLLRDIVAGVILRLQDGLVINQNIRFQHISGKIASLHLAHLRIVNQDGDAIKVPYSKISNEIIAEVAGKDDVDQVDLQIRLKKTFTREEYLERIRFLLLNAPWSSSKKPTFIQMKQEAQDYFLFSIKIHTLNTNHTALIEKYLKEKLRSELVDR
ncbi:MAG: mechanosensitive ion channel domain-containing protein [Candidatus Cyclobacteriaceae bacterium M3_2C_046]